MESGHASLSLSLSPLYLAGNLTLSGGFGFTVSRADQTKLVVFQYRDDLSKGNEHIWNLEDDNEVTSARFVTVEGRTLLVVCLTNATKVWSEDGKRLLTHIKHLAPSIKDQPRGDLQHYFKGVAAVTAENGKELVAVGDSVGSIYTIDAKTEGAFKSALSTSIRPEVPLNCLDSADTGTLLAADVQGFIHILNVRSAEEITHLRSIDCKTENTPITGMRAIPASHAKGSGLVAICDYLGRLKLVSLVSYRVVVEIAAHARVVTSLDLSVGRGVFIATCSEDTYVNVWRLDIDSTGVPDLSLKTSKRIEDLPLMAVRFPPGSSDGIGKVLVAAHESRELFILSNVY